MTYMSTAERLVKLHDTMCENIEAMGGTVDPTKTLIEIAGEILNIPPVPVGVSIDTATTCAADKATTSINSPVVFTGKVSAYHDDTTSADVDLIGYLKGATVKFYNGQTLLGSTTTDNNGEYSFSYTPIVAGELSVIAMFEAIEDYKQSSSTAVVITVSSYSDIVMSADKPILSYADHEKATLYAQLVDDNDTPLAIEGVTLTFKKDSTILGTADTDSTGLATLVDGYTSQGVGDVTLSVTDGTFLTKIYEVQDCKKYISSTTVNTVSSNSDFNIKKVLDYDSSLLEFSGIFKQTSRNGGFNTVLAIASATGEPISQSRVSKVLTMGAYSSTVGTGYYSGSSFTSQNRDSYTVTTNVEYECILQIKDNNNWYCKITDITNNNVIYEQTDTIPITLTDYALSLLAWGSVTTTWKDVKVKPL